jgi:hypothetical protein
MVKKDGVKTRLEFYAAFEKRTNDKIISIEMAGLKANPEVLGYLEIEGVPDPSCVWGLLIFCENGLYFDILPSDNLILLIMQRSSGKKDKEEKVVSLHKLSGLDFKIPDRRWYDFMSSRKYLVAMKFFDADDKEQICAFQLQKKAEKVADKFLKYSHKEK